MQTYMNVGYSADNGTAPNNFFGRLGATLYDKTGDGVGAAMGGLLGGGFCLTFPIFAFIDGHLLLGLILSLITLLIFAVPAVTLYARLTYTKHGNAAELSRIREQYRKMSREDRAIVRPLVHNLEKCALLDGGYSYKSPFYQRMNKFDEFVQTTQEKQSAAIDDSDIDSVDNFLTGLRELQANHKKSLTGRSS